MDGFGDDFVNSGDVDPAADFIAREQDELAGLDDPIPAPEHVERDPSPERILNGGEFYKNRVYCELIIIAIISCYSCTVQLLQIN